MLSRLILVGACAVLSTVAASASPSLDAARFRSLGPAISGGRLGAVAGTDADPALYYVGAAGGGVWKSTNGGQSFKPVFDDQGQGSIGAIAIDPGDEDVVWVGTGEADPRNDVTQGDGVYLTRDGGKTWKHALALHDALISAISIDPHDGRDVVVAVLGDPFADGLDRGVYRTTDGGATWKKTLYLGPASGASDVVRSPARSATLFAGMWQMRRTGWSLQSGGPDDGLFRSDDGGATWTRLNGHGLPSGITGRIGLTTGVSDPQRLYAVIESKQGLLWRSDDGGANWTMRDADPLIDERPFYFSRVFVDPSDADHLWSVSVHLTESRDGGKTFKIAGRGLHGDHHAMWIAAGGKRMIEGNDGGPGISNDGGATWSWNKSLPISQLYHVGYSRERPYSACMGLQDNGIWCVPANPLTGGSINAAQWWTPGGGDGTWAAYDPLDPHLVWFSSAGGNFSGDVEIHDTRTGETWSVAPYSRDQNVVDPRALRYRFNWETPIAFDPFDGHVAYVGADVLFASRDRGVRWKPISPDLTRNERSHQIVTGGITLDGTGAETSDTILAIEPSRVARGEIWVGTDDGLVKVTRDAGRRWVDVTPPFARSHPWGRFASLSASPVARGTVYAAYDRHMVGDRAPYLFATRDGGAHWTSISAGLPADAEARAVLADTRDARVVYAGIESGLWASWDGGAHWRTLRSGLPPVSVRDLRIQPDADDLLVATHGRGLYVLDDLRPVRELARRASGTRLFPIRDAVLWQTQSIYGTPRDGSGPAYGALVTYYQSAAAKSHPTAVVVDASGRIVRRYTTHDEDGKQVPDLDDAAGLNRFTWDLSENGTTPWNAAPAWNRGFDTGALVVPGRYVVRVTIAGKTYARPVVVKADPRLHYTQAQYVARRDAQRGLLADFDRVDGALDVLSTVVAEAPLRAAALRAAGKAADAEAVATAGTRAAALIPTFTSNAKNDQDDDFLKDVLRERLQTEIYLYSGSFFPPTPEQKRESADLHALTAARMKAYAAFASGALRAADAKARAAGLKPLESATAR